MNNKLVIFFSSVWIFNLNPMHKDNSIDQFNEVNFDHLPREVKLHIFQYITGRYNLDQIDSAINILSRVNREFRSLTIQDPELYLINRIKKDLIKCNYNCGLLFTSHQKQKEHEIIHYKINIFMIIVMVVVMTL